MNHKLSKETYLEALKLKVEKKNRRIQNKLRKQEELRKLRRENSALFQKLKAAIVLGKINNIPESVLKKLEKEYEDLRIKLHYHNQNHQGKPHYGNIALPTSPKPFQGGKFSPK